MPPGPPRPARRSSRYPPDWRQNRGYPVAMASAFRSASSGSSRQIAPSSDGRAARLATSAAVSGPKVTRLASERITSSESTWSTVMPYLTEWLPAELLPIIPPSVARLLVEVSGPNMSPYWAAARFNCSCTTPGWTRACRAAPSIARIWFMCLEKSITTARPTACPARLVPAPRASTGTPNSAAAATTAAASSPSLGEHHAERLDRVHARVAGEKVPAVGVEPHPAADHAAQRRPPVPCYPRAAAESGMLIPPSLEMLGLQVT